MVLCIALSVMFSRSIHVVRNGSFSSFLMAELYPTVVYVPHLHSPIFCQRTLGCPHVLATVSNAAMSIGVQISLLISVFEFFRQISRRAISGSYGNPVVIFLRNCQAVSIVVVPVYIPTSSEGGFLLIYNLANTYYYLSC